MLQTIREHTQGWIAGTIISIIILTFALWGIRSYFVEGASSNIVAHVNGADITKEQLTVAYERLRRQAQAQDSAGITSKDETAYRARALQALIEVETLKQASINEGYRVYNNQIDNYLQSMPEFQDNGQFSIDRFQQALASTLMSTSEFLDLIKTSLLIEQPRLGVIFTSFALPDETNYTVSLVNQQRDIQYINIPLQFFLARHIVITPEQIQTYYDQNKTDYMTPEQANVEYLQLSLKDLAATMKPSDAVLKSFYNENVNSYTQPMAWKLVDIEIPLSANATQDEIDKAQATATKAMKEINSGVDFAKVMQEYSQGFAMSKDWMTLNQVPVELQKAAAQLTKPNQVVGPMKTSKSIVIVKALDVREPKIQAFDAVKSKVNDTYVSQHAEEKFADMRDQLADITYEHPESLQLAAKTLSLPIKTSESFTKDKAGKDISQYKKVRETAFSNDVLNLQNNSDVIQLDPETVIVIRIKTHLPSTLLPLKDISKQIGDKLTAQEAEKQASDFAQQAVDKLNNGADADQFAKANQFTWVTSDNIGRYSTKVDSAILDVAFSLPSPANNKNKVEYGSTRLPGGYAIIALKAIKPGVISDKSQASVFSEQVQNSEGLLEYELYKQSQLKNAKIERLS